MSRRNYRNIAYRPERERRELEPDALRIFGWFCRRYLFPYKWLILLAAFLVSMNACSAYLMAWYSKIVIDDILVMESGVQTTPDKDSVESVLIFGKSSGTPQAPRHGELSERTMGLRLAGRTPGAMKKLGLMFMVYTLTIVLLNMSARLAAKSRIEVARAMTGRLRDDMHKKIMQLSRSFHQRYTPGQLMSRVMSDVNLVQNQMTALTVDAICHVITFLIGFGILLTVDRLAALICLAAVPPYGLIYAKVRRRLRMFNRELRHTNAWMYAYCAQKLDAVKAVLCYAMEFHERLNFFRLNACFLRDSVHQQRLSSGMNRSAGILATLATVAILLTGCVRVLNGTGSIGEMMYVYGTASNIFMPVLGLITLSATFNKVQIVLQRIMQVFDEPVEIKDLPGAVDFPAPLKQGIAVKNVTFAFSSESDPVLQNISFNVPAGKWLCIMGASGAGKSALLALLARLYEPSAGEITLDGIPISKIRLNSLRRHVSMVPQEAEIFSATIRDNISYDHPGVEPSMIMEAAKSADIHNFIMSLPVKYETLVGEKGTRLSGGQRQRISLARALITSPDVLLLDDCTSALDADTELKIQESLIRILEGKTAVMVSQRISMAMRCDKICVLSDGIVTETGSHQELLRMNGFYARIYSQQT